MTVPAALAAGGGTAVAARVSVIIPTFNVERYIRTTIDSVLAQRGVGVELIVVDDGSSDATCDIVRSYSGQVKLIEQANAGVCAARNRGLAEATAPFICFLDHDDFWYADKLARQVQAFATDPELGVVYSDFIRWAPGDDGAFADPATLDRGAATDGIDSAMSGWIYHLLLLDCWVLTSTAMFRVEVLRQCGAFDVDLPYSEDWDLWLRVARQYRFAKLRWPTTLYRQHRMQGSRVIRPIDYRTRLLAQAVARWGLASPDGTAIPARQFKAKLAEYHRSYGYDRLKAGQNWRACQSFAQAWRCQPAHLKSLLWVGAAMLGWRPRS